jgi:hypothetical protein
LMRILTVAIKDRGGAAGSGPANAGCVEGVRCHKG